MPAKTTWGPGGHSVYDKRYQHDRQRLSFFHFPGNEEGEFLTCFLKPLHLMFPSLSLDNLHVALDFRIRSSPLPTDHPEGPLIVETMKIMIIKMI